MKHFLLAIALACAISSTALAGDVPSTGAPAPGEIPTTGASAPATQSSSVVATVILAILSIVR